MREIYKTWKPVRLALWLLLSLGSFGCASTGNPASGSCPAPVRLPAIPQERMKAPTYERQILDTFSESAEAVTPR